MVEGGFERSKFPTKIDHPLVKEKVEEMLGRASGESMESIVEKLDEKDKKIGEILLDSLKKMESWENDPTFKQVKKLKNCISCKRKDKGERVIYRSKGVIPYALIDILALITSNNEFKSFFDPMFVKEEYIRNIHPDIKIIRQSYKAKWPTKPRDFIMGIWVHLTPEGYVKIPAVSCEDPNGPEVKGHIRGQIIVAGWVMKPIDENTTECLYVSQLELAGSIPGFVKDSVAKNQGGIIDKVIEGMAKFLNPKKK